MFPTPVTVENFIPTEVRQKYNIFKFKTKMAQINFSSLHFYN
jgi:hypothetical protein